MPNKETAACGMAAGEQSRRFAIENIGIDSARQYGNLPRTADTMRKEFSVNTRQRPLNFQVEGALPCPASFLAQVLA